MSRTIFVWDEKQQKIVEKSQHSSNKEQSGPYFVPDIVPFRSILDGTEISSRPQLEEHNRRHKVIDVGDLRTADDFDNNKHNPLKPVCW